MINIFNRFNKALSKDETNGSGSIEPLMYRIELFNELLRISGREMSKVFFGERILEIGPKDGLDSKRLQSLSPSELVMIDLPEKREGNKKWLSQIKCTSRYIEANLMYMSKKDIESLGAFQLIWCTGVLYHNAEQLRMIRKLYNLLNVGGYLVLESATLRDNKLLHGGCFVQIYYPETYRNTGTVTHLPTANAIKAWLHMAGFNEIFDSTCYNKYNKNLIGERYACICKKNKNDESGLYYNKSGLNEKYIFGESS